MFRTAALLVMTTTFALQAATVAPPKLPLAERIDRQCPLMTDLCPPAVHNNFVNVVTGQFCDAERDLDITGVSGLGWGRMTNASKLEFGHIASGWKMGASLPEPSRVNERPGYPYCGELSLTPTFDKSKAVQTIPAEQSLIGLPLVQLRSVADLNFSKKRSDGSTLDFNLDSRMRKERVVARAKSGVEIGSLDWIYDAGHGRTTIVGHDGQEVSYAVAPDRRLVAVSRNRRPYCSYDHGAEGAFRYGSEAPSLRVTAKRYITGRYVEFDYYAARENTVGDRKVYLEGRHLEGGRRRRGDHPSCGRIKEQREPAGPDGAHIVTARYFYDYNFENERSAAYSGGTTQVYDASGNRTVYEWDDSGTVTKRVRFSGENELIAMEEWWTDEDGSRFKALYNKQGIPTAAVQLVFDASGNRSETRFFEGPLPTLRGKVVLSGCPSDAITFLYAPSCGDEDRCICIESDGERIEYTHLGETDLITSALTSANGVVLKRSFYTYDDHGICTEEIHDNGCGEKSSDLTGVTERTRISIDPSLEVPTVGMPLKIERFEWNEEDGCEEPIESTTYKYGIFNQVTEEVKCDGKGQEVSKIVSTYDEENGRLKTRSANNETETYTYCDATGLLKEKETAVKKGKETTTKREVYTYDKVGNLVKTDFFEGAS